LGPNTCYPRHRPKTSCLLHAAPACLAPSTARTCPTISAAQDELNARYADTGDAVALSSRMHVVASDISRSHAASDRLRLPLDPMEIFNLGTTILGNEPPKAYTLDAPSPAESALAYNEQLEAKLYDLAGIPDVMRGKVDGTQRSGEALAALALPSLALITEYRSPFRTNLQQAWLAFMAMSFEARLNKVGLEDFGHKMDMEFAPILPRDVAQINDTIAIQRSAAR
jgi:hypothetical protein